MTFRIFLNFCKRLSPEHIPIESLHIVNEKYIRCLNFMQVKSGILAVGNVSCAGNCNSRKEKPYKIFMHDKTV